MEQATLRIDRQGVILKEWVVAEYTQHERSRAWLIIASLVVLVLLTLSLWTPNPIFSEPNILFFSIVVVTVVTIVARHSFQPPLLSVILFEDGVAIGDAFYPYRDLKNFAIVYEPPEVKMMYFHFQSGWQPRLPVPLMDENPVQVREILALYLAEDMERDSEPTSDAFGRWLKL